MEDIAKKSIKKLSWNKEFTIVASKLNMQNMTPSLRVSTVTVEHFKLKLGEQSQRNRKYLIWSDFIYEQ